MNNKGMMDFFVITLFVFVIGIAVVLGVILLTQFYQEAELPMYEAINMTEQNFEDTITVLDYFIPIVLVGMGITILVVSFTIETHPIFFIIGLFTASAGVVASAVISNTMMETFNETSGYMGSALGITQQAMSGLPYIMLAIFSIALIIFYGKAYGGGQSV